MVFPAYGVIAMSLRSDAHLLYSPHAGVIGEAADGELGPVVFPCMRGLSVRLLTENWDLFVFPARGVIGRPGARRTG